MYFKLLRFLKTYCIYRNLKVNESRKNELPLHAGHFGVEGTKLHFDFGGGFHEASGGSFNGVAICYSRDDYFLTVSIIDEQ